MINKEKEFKMKSTNEFKIGIIYMYISPSGKRYIGQTINEKSRKSQHKKNSIKDDTKFGRALRKYGYDNFEYKILIKFSPTLHKEKLKRILNKLEKRYIILYDSIVNGYNLTTGGDSFLHSVETIEKLKVIGNNMTDEHKQKLSIAAKERCKDGLSDYILGNLAKGWESTPTMSDTTKQKISDSRKNKKEVHQYDLQLNLLNTYQSIADAAKSIESTSTLKTKSNRISECINGKHTTAYNYVWTKS